MTWSFWLYLGIAAPWFLCTVLYGLRSPWWESWTGRGQFATYVSLTAALGLTVLFRGVRFPHVVVLAVAVTVLSAVGVAGIAQLVNIIRLQR